MRGFNIFDLAIHSTFEETTYLLLYGELPTRRQLLDFSRLLAHHRPVPPTVMDVLEQIPTARTHPMAALRTAVSALGNLDDSAEKLTVAAETEEIPEKVAADEAYQAARRNSDEQNARVEHDKALGRVMTGIINDALFNFAPFIFPDVK